MVSVRVPATIANLGPALDVLGIAVSLYNWVEIDVTSVPQVEVHGEGEGVLPGDERNLVYRSAAAVAAASGRTAPFFARCRNGIPIARGLGSSAAAIVAGAVGANELLGRPLDRDALLELAFRMEGHPDNVAAALLGGAVLVDSSSGALSCTRIAPAWQAALVVAVPQCALATEEARRVLPGQIPLRDAVANVSHAAHLVTALLTGRTDLLRRGLEDVLHQPYRKPLVPGMDAVFQAARDAGAFGAALSGAGPSIVAVTPLERADEAGEAMVSAFASTGERATYLKVQIDRQGATIITPDATGGTRDPWRENN